MVGFSNWKKVNDGNNCPFITHVGGSPCSAHNNSVRAKLDLLNDRGHIRHALIAQGEEQIKRNRLRLRTSIDVVRYNDEVSKAIENPDYNAKYVASSIQKEILQIISAKVRNHIREEIGESKFCIIVDEARDEARREQMAIVLRFVDKNGSIREQFLQLVRVNDTSATTLKRELCLVLKEHNLLVENIHGQGYDGASNMRGEWNGLQALFLADCPYAYYVHCFAHRLQLALVLCI
ncbi:uncharacterized protein LOC141587733 [Silene latifolia]|uniref:uncharacterized protein LOC141587733 n=1 Tax=Silene latifolia TaxID=37657 RepID=UPI003D7709E6